MIGLVTLYLSGRLVNSSGEKFNTVREGGCELRVISLYDQYGTQFNSPWRIKDRIFNTGPNSCVIQSTEINPKGPVTISGGEVFEKEWIVERVPIPKTIQFSAGVAGAVASTSSVTVYGEQE